MKQVKAERWLCSSWKQMLNLKMEGSVLDATLAWFPSEVARQSDLKDGIYSINGTNSIFKWRGSIFNASI